MGTTPSKWSSSSQAITFASLQELAGRYQDLPVVRIDNHGRLGNAQDAALQLMSENRLAHLVVALQVVNRKHISDQLTASQGKRNGGSS